VSATIDARTASARLRVSVAQKLCNQLARDLERAFDGDKAVACVDAGALVALGLDKL
jgi:hypothetical protein